MARPLERNTGSMILHTMYVEKAAESRSLVFDLNLHAPGLPRQLGFVVLIAESFDGTIDRLRRHVRDEHHPFGSVAVTFQDEDFRRASTFCDEKLVENGQPHRSIDDAIEEADFRGAKSGELSRKLHSAPHEDGSA